MRLQKDDFEEEFEPTNTFRYNISNFDQIMDSMSDDDDDDDEEDDEDDEDDAGNQIFGDSERARDSISVGSNTIRRKGSRKDGPSIYEDDEEHSGEGEDEDEDQEDESGSVVSRTKSEALGRRSKARIVNDANRKKLKR